MSTKKRETHAAHTARTSSVPHTSHTAIGEGPTEKPAPVVPNVSDDDRAGTLRVRAYKLWEQAGKPDGDAARVQFWCEAEKENMADHAPG